MKNGKSAEPSGLLSDIVKTAGEGVDMITGLVSKIIVGVIPGEWEHSIIVNYYKSKGDALKRHYKEMKLTDQDN